MMHMAMSTSGCPRFGHMRTSSLAHPHPPPPNMHAYSTLSVIRLSYSQITTIKIMQIINRMLDDTSAALCCARSSSEPIVTRILQLHTEMIEIHTRTIVMWNVSCSESYLKPCYDLDNMI